MVSGIRPSVSSSGVESWKKMGYGKTQVQNFFFSWINNFSLPGELRNWDLVILKGTHNPWEALQSYSGLPLWSLVEDCLSPGWLFMTFFLKMPQILVVAIWICSQIVNSCRMSEYSTGPAAVRKEQGVVKVLWFQTHSGFLFFLAHAKWRMEYLPSPFTFPLSGGTDGCHARCLQGQWQRNDLFFSVPPYSLLNLFLNWCSDILQRYL